MIYGLPKTVGCRRWTAERRLPVQQSWLSWMACGSFLKWEPWRILPCRRLVIFGTNPMAFIYIYIHIDNRSNRSWSTKGLQNIFEQTVLVPWGIVSYKHIVMFTMIVMIASIIMTVASVTMIVIMNSMYYGTILIIIDLYCVSAICFPAIYWLVGFLMNSSGRFPLGTSAQSKS